MLVASESLLTVMIGPGSWSSCVCCLVCLAGVALALHGPEPINRNTGKGEESLSFAETEKNLTQTSPLLLNTPLISSNHPPSVVSTALLPLDSLMAGAEKATCDGCRDAATLMSDLQQQLLTSQQLVTENHRLGPVAEILKRENSLLEKQLEEVSAEAERLQVCREVWKGFCLLCGTNRLRVWSAILKGGYDPTHEGG